jgi:regulator of sigma E protease
MDWIFNFLSTVGIFIAALFILVLVHELGHFLAAKLFGMRVERFSIGFPPRVFGKQIGDTDYCISATPLGGYVKISGMVDESMDTDQLAEEPKPWEFRSKPVWQRIIVIVAGVVFNMILAVMIFAGIIMTYGEANIPVANIKGIYVEQGSLPDQLGFRSGDKLVGVNGKPVTYFNELLAPGEITRGDVSYTVIRDGQEMVIPIPGDFIDRLNKERSFIELTQALPPIVGSVMTGSSADKAGLAKGDTIKSIDGRAIGFWSELTSIIRSSEGSLNFSISRAGKDTVIAVTPNPDTKTIGISTVNAADYFGAVFTSHGFFASFGRGAAQTWDTTIGILNGFGRMFSGDISVRENLGGPIAIANYTKEATDGGGWLGFWNITALLSITLAIMNLLPIPVLDGGHLVFLIYEGITRREPSLKVRMVLQQVGFIMIIGLMIFVTFNDIVRFAGF